MKKTGYVLAVIVLSVCFASGCSKKKEPAAPSSAGERQATDRMDQAMQTAQNTAQAAKEAVSAAADEVKQAFTSQVNLDKSVADLKAEAEKMDIASLTAVAGKYKDAILAKQSQFSAISEKLSAIPMTQRLGDEAKQLTAEAQQITESLKALTDRFNVYVNAIKAKGGNVSDLSV